MSRMYTFTSVQEHYDSKNGGSQNIVHIKNGRGYKEHANLTPSGKVVGKSRHTLKREELKNISNGRFVPKLWKCCGARKRTRKQRRA